MRVHSLPNAGRGGRFTRVYCQQQKPYRGVTPIQLPGGGYWWLGLRRDVQEVYGEDFIIFRPSNSEGLVASPRPPVPQAYSSPPRVRNTTIAHKLLTSGVIVVDTTFDVVPDNNSDCVGIVPLFTPTVVSPADTRHPRRTKRIHFTCRLCGEKNDKAINPHAWATGSVFARCDGCSVVHKLKDNLKIFSEMAGPIFPPRNMRDAFLVEELLQKIAERRRDNGFSP